MPDADLERSLIAAFRKKAEALAEQAHARNHTGTVALVRNEIALALHGVAEELEGKADER